MPRIHVHIITTIERAERTRHIAAVEDLDEIGEKNARSMERNPPTKQQRSPQSGQRHSLPDDDKGEQDVVTTIVPVTAMP